MEVKDLVRGRYYKCAMKGPFGQTVVTYLGTGKGGGTDTV